MSFVVDGCRFDFKVKSHCVEFIVYRVNESFCDGYLKWDGCLNIRFCDGGYEHFCNELEAGIILKVIKHIYAYTKENLDSFDPC